MTEEQPQPPEHLSDESAAWFESVASTYQLEGHHVRLLTAACTAWDRANEAREIIATEGAIFHDKNGAPRKHPAAAVELESRASFVKCLRELQLDVAAPGDENRTPRNARTGRRFR